MAGCLQALASARTAAAGTVLDRMTTAARCQRRHSAPRAEQHGFGLRRIDDHDQQQPGVRRRGRRRGRGRRHRSAARAWPASARTSKPRTAKPRRSSAARPCRCPWRPGRSRRSSSPFVAIISPSLRCSLPCTSASACHARQELKVRRHVVHPQQLHAPVQRPLRRRQRGGSRSPAGHSRSRAPPSSPCATRRAGPGSRGRGTGPGGAGRRDCPARAWRSTGPDRR